MFNRYFDSRIRTLKRRVNELEDELKSINDKERLYAIYSHESTLEQEGVFKLLLDNVNNDIVSLSSPSNMIVYISPSCFRHLGYLPDEIEGRSLLSFVPPDDRNMMNDFLHHVNSTKFASVVVHRFIHKDGSFVWLESTWKTVFLEYNGQLSQTVISIKTNERTSSFKIIEN